jgi:hypothetical protein
MSGFLHRLVDRLHPSSPRVMPRLRSRFEPASIAEDVSPIEATTSVVRPNEPAPPPVSREQDFQESAPPAAKARHRRLLPLLPPSSDGAKGRQAGEVERIAADQPVPSKKQPPPHNTTPEVAADAPHANRPAEPVEPVRIQPRQTIEPRRASEDGPAREGPALRTMSPSVHITIGRVEVRAITASTPKKRERAAPTPSLPLADYLKQRNGGGP